MPIFTHSVKAKKSVLVYLSKSCLPFIFFYINFVRHVTLDVHVLSQREKKNVYSKKYYNVNLIQHKNEDMLYLQTDFPSSVKTLKYGAPFFLKLILLFSISELEALQISKYLMKTFGKIQFNRK